MITMTVEETQLFYLAQWVMLLATTTYLTLLALWIWPASRGKILRTILLVSIPLLMANDCSGGKVDPPPPPPASTCVPQVDHNTGEHYTVCY